MRQFVAFSLTEMMVIRLWRFVAKRENDVEEEAIHV
jgi:hypothetical protein